MKKLLLVIAFLFFQAATAQTTFKFTTRTYLGENVYAIAEVQNTDTEFSIRSRKLPGMPKPAFYTDSVNREGDKVSGSLIFGRAKIAFTGTVFKDSISLTLNTISTKNFAGTIQGVPYDGQKIADYHLLTKKIVATTEQYHYDISLANHKSWKKFKRRISLMSRLFKDDLEMVGLFYMMSRSLPFSHYGFTKMSESSWQKTKIETRDTPQIAHLEEIDRLSTVLKINSFGGDGSRIDSLMQIVLGKGYQNLAIDLRGNSGGGAGAAMQLVKYFTPTIQPSGALVTKRWFADNNRIPTEADYNQFKNFGSGSTVDLIADLNTQKGIVIVATPAPNQYNGKLYILTDKFTASTCEPIVYAMQYYKRATIIGEKTAGSMLSQTPFDLGNGYVLKLPLADYYTVDGKRLDKIGVTPDIAIEADKAMTTFLRLIETGLSFK